MKKNITALAFAWLALPLSLFAQIDSAFYAQYKRESCQKKDAHYMPNKDTFFLDYVMQNVVDSTLFQYFEDRRKLYPISKSLMLDDYVAFRDTINLVSIHATFHKRSILTRNLKHLKREKSNAATYLESMDGRQIYGLSYNRRRASLIDNFEIVVNNKSIDIPDSIFSNLFFPDFNIEFKSIKPLSLYYSAKKNAFYLYIFGLDQLPGGSEPDMRRVNTYFSKIIFNEQQYISQITIPYGALFRYQMDRCYFIGF